MSLTSAMGASVGGLAGQSARLAAISDNIANSSTYGYKKVSTDFDSLVLSQGGGGYSAGGVVASTSRSVDQSSGLVPSTNPGSLAIAGSGMLAVTERTGVNSPPADQSMLLTRTGNFTIDKEGYLQTETGLVLLGFPANQDGTFPAVARDSKTSLEPVRFTNAQGTGTPTTKIKLIANLPASNTEPTDTNVPVGKIGEDDVGEAIVTPVNYYGNIGTEEKLDFSFTPHLNKETGRSDKWTMTVIDYSSDPEGVQVASLVIEFSEERDNAANLKTVKGDGYDPATGILTFKIGDDEMQVEMGKPGNSREFLKQDSGLFNPQKISVDGSGTAERVSYSIDAEGYVTGVFGKAGTTKKLFKIPLVSVPNYNGLIARSSQTFTLSPEAGRFYLWDSGTGPVGILQGYARENSTTDIAEELTNMIQTQRAYASNAKVITTVDEMLQETMNIKR